MSKRFGTYEIIESLGAGGMGQVFRARDTELARDVALKVLPDAFLSDPQRLSRFEREARVLASLNHPNIATIYAVASEGDRRALALELVEGDDLSRQIPQGGMPANDAFRIAAQIADAIEAAHEQSVIHRDLKPANVMVTPDGTVKVLDFGLAKALDPTEQSVTDPAISQSPTIVSGATTHGIILGTAAYMSPEQARGRVVDKRADIWAFGCVLFEMLSGRRPFGGETVSDTLASILKEPPPWDALPGDTDPVVRHLLARCLEKDAKKRLRDIGEARIAIDSVLGGEAVPAGAGLAPGDLAGDGGASTHHARTTERVAWITLAVAALLAGALARPIVFGDGGVAPLTTAPAPQPRLRPLTFEPGAELYPTVTPDGEWLVYAARDGGDWDIFLRSVGGDNPINLTRDSDADDTQPTLSPDGRRIAFRSERQGGGLFVMGRTGESVRRVTAEGFDPAWSPDGTRIVYALAPASQAPYSRTAIDLPLRIVDIDTGETQPLEVRDGVQPDWSPDGGRIAYWGLRTGTGQRDIWTVPAGGGEAVAVTEDAATDWCPTWSPDGRHLYYASDRSGQMNLWRVAIDPTTGEVSSVAEPVTFGGTTFVAQPFLSRAGERLVYIEQVERTNAWRVPIDPERAVATGPAEQVTFGARGVVFPAISPDGEWLAYTTFVPGQPEDIYVTRLDGTRLTRLTNDGFKDRVPRWSPDGEHLVFFSDRTGTYVAWVVNRDGSGLEPVTPDSLGMVLTTSWDAEGRRLIGSRVLEGDIVTITFDADGSTHADLQPGPGELVQISDWDPAHDLAAVRLFNDDISDPNAIGTLRIGTGEVRRVAGGTSSPMFLGNEWLVWASSNRDVDAARIDGSDRHLLYHAEGEFGAFGQFFSFSTDNRWMYVSLSQVEADVWMMEWPEESTH